MVDGVVEPEPALGDELHDDGRHEALGHAANPEPVVRACRTVSLEVGFSGSDDGTAAVLLDERDHGRDLARGDEPVGSSLKLGFRRSAGAQQKRPDDDGHEPDAEPPENPHVSDTQRVESPLHDARGATGA